MKTLKVSEIISRNIYLHDLIVAVFGKKFPSYVNSFVLEVQFQSIFFQEFMATQDSVQWVKEDVNAAVLLVSPKWTIFDKPVMKVDSKSYISQCSL